MSKTKIEWTDYSVNPVKGLCPQACPYCYARRMYQRFHWDKTIRYDPESFAGLPEKPAKVFVGSTMELFGDWVDRDWMHMTFAKILARPQHTFIFLTKQPRNLAKWSPFPDNCCIGVSVTRARDFLPGIYGLTDIQCSTRFLSFEPLLESVMPNVLPAEWDDAVDQVIIGQQTPAKASTMPKIEWVREIVEAADKSGIPVFLKDNLYELLRYDCGCGDRHVLAWGRNKNGTRSLRQEWPKP